jgi:hypothetical protein
MRKSTKIVGGFAALGFTLPVLLLTFSSNSMLLIYLCPPSIVALAFAIDGQSPLPPNLVIWLICCLGNALLYSVLAFAGVRIYRMFRSHTWPSRPQLR